MRTHRESQQSVGAGHPLVRRYLDIKRGRTPRSDPGVALEGLWALRAAASAGVSVEAAFVCPELLRGDQALELLDGLETTGTKLLRVGDRMLRRMVERDGPDGVAAIARHRQPCLADIPVGAGTRIVVADRFELVGNLGTVVRCADGAGAAGVVAVDCPFRLTHPLLIKASMGTVFSLPVVAASRPEVAGWLRRRGFRIVAADPAATISYRDAEYGTPLAIVLGSERQGLGAPWAAEADVAVSIPMLGVADSLNVGHAAALLLYEALRQHGA